MKHRTVADVMTTDVVTVTAQTPFKDLAGLFVDRRISALPVLSRQGKITGIVRETDLLMKEELQHDPGTGSPLLRRYRAMRARACGDSAGEVMTTQVVTVRPEATVAEAARLMDKHHVTCLPVVDETGKLAGIISPRDLLRIFLRPDTEIRDEIFDEILHGYLGTNPVLVNVDVSDGVVILTGEVERKTMIPLVLPLIQAVDGVVDAEAELTYAIDDTHLPPAPGQAEH